MIPRGVLLVLALVVVTGAVCMADVTARDTTVAAYEEPPVLVSRAPIHYPPAAKKAGVEGDVMLMLHVDRQGKVTHVGVSRSARADLDSAAVESARGWTFTPAKRKGVAVEATVALPVRFKLEKKEGSGEGEAAGEGEGPVPLSRVNPAYPQGAKKRGVEGTVYVETTIDRTGAVVDVKVMKGVDPELDAAAVEALRQWTFKPPQIPGSGDLLKAVIPVKFRLGEKEEDRQ